MLPIPAAAIINATTEEVVFRGAILSILNKLPGWLAVVISGVTFAISHWSSGIPSGMVGVGAAFMFGMALALLYRLSKSILLLITVHCVVNAVMLVSLQSSIQVVVDMDSFVMPRRPLGPIVSWDTLVGLGWESYVRVLHPALREEQTGETLAAVPWRDIASTDIDLATADWFTVSGVRLHTGKSGFGWDIEPYVGPGDPKVAPRLFPHLLDGVNGPCWVGYWTGYGHERPENAQTLSLGRNTRTYDVLPLTSTQRDVMATGSATLPTYPDIAWDEGASFLMVTDIDLPCTVIGCTTAVAQRIFADSELEALRVDPAAPIVT